MGRRGVSETAPTRNVGSIPTTRTNYDNLELGRSIVSDTADCIPRSVTVVFGVNKQRDLPQDVRRTIHSAIERD